MPKNTTISKEYIAETNKQAVNTLPASREVQIEYVDLKIEKYKATKHLSWGLFSTGIVAGCIGYLLLVSNPDSPAVTVLFSYGLAGFIIGVPIYIFSSNRLRYFESRKIELSLILNNNFYNVTSSVVPTNNLGLKINFKL